LPPRGVKGYAMQKFLPSALQLIVRQIVMQKRCLPLLTRDIDFNILQKQENQPYTTFVRMYIYAKLE
jgi:hypothetical protein